MGMACGNSSRIMHLLECVFILEHCTALWSRDIILQVQGACEGTTRPRD